MKLMWTGTDALFYSSFPPRYYKYYYIIALRIFARIADFFVQEHYIVSEHLRKELRGLKKPIKVLEDPPLNPEKVEKLKHEGINILYFYKPGRFWHWIYGYDIIILMDRMFPDINFIRVDGSQDMSEVYPVINGYLRPNRHDGCPRMVMECKINDIPYYWSYENPDIKEIKQWLTEFTK